MSYLAFPEKQSIPILRDSEFDFVDEEALQAAGITYHTIKLPWHLPVALLAENEEGERSCKVLTADDGTVLVPTCCWSAPTDCVGRHGYRRPQESG